LVYEANEEFRTNSPTWRRNVVSFRDKANRPQARVTARLHYQQEIKERATRDQEIEDIKEELYSMADFWAMFKVCWVSDVSLFRTGHRH